MKSPPRTCEAGPRTSEPPSARSRSSSAASLACGGRSGRSRTEIRSTAAPTHTRHVLHRFQAPTHSVSYKHVTRDVPYTHVTRGVPYTPVQRLALRDVAAQGLASQPLRRRRCPGLCGLETTLARTRLQFGTCVRVCVCMSECACGQDAWRGESPDTRRSFGPRHPSIRCSADTPIRQPFPAQPTSLSTHATQSVPNPHRTQKRAQCSRGTMRASPHTPPTSSTATREAAPPAGRPFSQACNVTHSSLRGLPDSLPYFTTSPPPKLPRGRAASPAPRRAPWPQRHPSPPPDPRWPPSQQQPRRRRAGRLQGWGEAGGRGRGPQRGNDPTIGWSSSHVGSAHRPPAHTVRSVGAQATVYALHAPLASLTAAAAAASVSKV
jgi:hypothetical protein